MEKSVIERIRQFIKIKDISVRAFEAACGFSNGYIRQVKRSPTVDKIESIIYAFPELNKEWLMTGEGEMIKKEQETSPAHDHTAEDALGSSGEPVAMLIREISEHRKLTQKALEELAACQRLLSSSQELLHTSQAQLTTSQRQLSTAQGQVSTLIGHADDAPSHRRDTAPDLDRIPWEEVK